MQGFRYHEVEVQGYSNKLVVKTEKEGMESHGGRFTDLGKKYGDHIDFIALLDENEARELAAALSAFADGRDYPDVS